jgi:hypothetical protein
MLNQDHIPALRVPIGESARIVNNAAPAPKVKKTRKRRSPPAQGIGVKTLSLIQRFDGMGLTASEIHNRLKPEFPKHTVKQMGTLLCLYKHKGYLTRDEDKSWHVTKAGEQFIANPPLRAIPREQKPAKPRVVKVAKAPTRLEKVAAMPSDLPYEINVILSRAMKEMQEAVNAVALVATTIGKEAKKIDELKKLLAVV